MLVTMLAGAVAAVGAPASARADDQDPPEVPATPGAWIAGVGCFVYDEPGTFGHQIRFGVVGWVDRHGTGHGVFRFRHALPDGSVASEGQAEVLFLRGVVASPRRVGWAATVRTWRSG
ncbi:hypothetical protein ACLQ3F_09220 [Micromonospora sp. DT15]|uniref:hypothetical protein n=1 Tax=Micromonospora sp. DT15 TaxID=3393445 RepID=UPI003CF5B510